MRPIMATSAWKTLLAGWPWFQGEGSYPLAAYSEFMPPPRLGRKAYSPVNLPLFAGTDKHGWPVTEYEEAFELQPGLHAIALQIVHSLEHLGHGRSAHGIARGKLIDNPYWPTELAQAAGSLNHERYVTLAPLALSRTQDDKGRLKWTLFGGSEQGPARAFWRGFFTAPGWEVPEEHALAFLRRLLRDVYDEPEKNLADLRRAGFRILPLGEDPPFPHAGEGPLPEWTAPLLLGKGASPRGVRFLLTFRPFGRLPAGVRRAYLAGELHLLPFPGSLVFWGAPPYVRLQAELPMALQIPLLNLIGRHEGWHGIRVPQSGWMHEHGPGSPEPDTLHGPLRNTYQRTHRWEKIHRHESELSLDVAEDRLAHVLFSAHADDCGLYGKPMARNAQVWTHDMHLLLDGPRADRADLERAMNAVAGGGTFGYRFHFPAMRVGRHALIWHRPLVAYLSAQTGQPEVLADAPLGYLTAYDADAPDLTRPVELWPRLFRREPHLEAVLLCDLDPQHQHHPYQGCLNVRKLLDTRELLDEPLPPSLARQLLTVAKDVTLTEWLDALPAKVVDAERGRHLESELRKVIAAKQEDFRGPLTFGRTARRSFEVAYWKTIAFLAEGKYLTKNNADCVRDPVTQKHLAHRQRDLDFLGDYLLDYYRKAVAKARLTGKALVGDLPFRWQTDFHYAWSGGWLNNQEGEVGERDLIVVIPGRDRNQAVILADHYDTAYMADHYEKQYGGDGARLAAAGADDNHSATACMMLGAPIFLEMSRQGKLACDVWLIHLTGEEFPADCLGARHLTQSLVEGTLTMRLPGGKTRDLSGTRVRGLYVMDMIAHNNDHDRDVFQIAPGVGRESMGLAFHAHQAAELWNAGTEKWNRRASRKEADAFRRVPHGHAVPDVAPHLALHGEVRPPFDPRSTLYNTDGQIFSDAGVPAVLFMENYDINRSGYHDRFDTMANIDLDYGAAFAAIAIETVARTASAEIKA
jgi:hypothetical protein